ADAAVADARRPAEDRADDARRKAAESLVFMRLAPGLKVFEMEAGGGWYTELMSHAVGPTGKVFMQNPPGFLEFVGDKVEARLKDGRLANVTETISNFDELEAPDASVDLVTWVHGPHELYFKPSEGVTLGDPAGSYAEMFRILKPGGSLVVIDHAAKPGSDETTGDTLHRIDKAIVLQMAKTAGFRLVDESALLANPKDPRTKDVFDESIKGYTDQFTLRFVKD
ncbi:MAG: class I SAM-dependent methyltransferase, partial [Parvularculaceae bacterium]|nr:class I SAM-dependent methyltransferase [Parvularculaceae bacterium]